jgi:lipopolysaccharide/colanic/teichoic acid biosynthesis glycosyltransferase
MYSGANVLEEAVAGDLVRSSTIAVQRPERVFEAAPLKPRVVDETKFPQACFIPTRRWWYIPIKATAEWLISLALLVLTAPLMLVLMAIVKLTSPGPVFYSQTRLGRFGRKYQMHKLRTMVHNAEAGTGPVWAHRNDVRITAFGKVLRRTHFDELPQLWNILRGEMCLIGPRPERPEISTRIEEHLPEFRQRLSVRPGVTGLAQMRLPADDPGDVGMDNVKRKLAHDLLYVREMSFLMDLRIAISTPCYFIAATINATHRILVRSYGITAETEFAARQDEQGNKEAV